MTKVLLASLAVAAAIAAPIAVAADTSPPVNVTPPSIVPVSGYTLKADKGKWQHAKRFEAEWATCDTNAENCVWEAPIKIDAKYTATQPCDECTVRLVVFAYNKNGAAGAEAPGAYSFPPLG